jgi:hypothetical protein
VDSAVINTDEEKKLQNTLDKLQEVCMECMMDITEMKTKVLVISKKGEETCNTVMNGTTLEQVLKCKYLGSVITDDGRCAEEVKTRIAMAKEALWQHKQLLQGNLKSSMKKRILACYEMWWNTHVKVRSLASIWQNDLMHLNNGVTGSLWKSGGKTK